MLCVSFSKPDIKPFLSEHPEVELIEIRMDRMELAEQTIQELFSLPINIIVTCRPNERMNDKERLSLLKKAVSAGAAYIDLELENEAAFLKEVIVLARAHKCKVILSSHNFITTPRYEVLKKTAEQCRDKGADIIKIASMVHNERDAENLKRLYTDFHPIIALGMGEKGIYTRLNACQWGAPFTYAAAAPDETTAPGQLDYATMRNLLE